MTVSEKMRGSWDQTGYVVFFLCFCWLMDFVGDLWFFFKTLVQFLFSSSFLNELKGIHFTFLLLLVLCTVAANAKFFETSEACHSNHAFVFLFLHFSAGGWFWWYFLVPTHWLLNWFGTKVLDLSAVWNTIQRSYFSVFVVWIFLEHEWFDIYLEFHRAPVQFQNVNTMLFCHLFSKF